MKNRVLGSKFNSLYLTLFSEERRVRSAVARRPTLYRVTWEHIRNKNTKK